MKLHQLLVLILLFFSVSNLFAQNQTFTSKLPIVYIDTYGNEIEDSPRIKAKLEIAWNENGNENSTSDSKNHFQGEMKIEIRGSSSQMFPKKSYGFELKDDFDADMDFPLLGMPAEEDWILYAPYTDKSLMRNVLTLTLADQIGGVYAPRCKFVELFVNNKYDGVYVLMEQIKRDSSRVDIAKLREQDIEGKQLTGGYIIKIDKKTGGGGDGWESKFNNTNNSKTYYQYDYPSSSEIQPEQKDYIRDYVKDFETAIYNEDRSAETGYANFMEPESFYNYIIMNEFSKNVDGYRLSTYLYKDKNKKLNAGPLWDYNLAYGNADYYNGWEIYGLQVNEDLGTDYWQIPFWWKKLVNDEYFANSMKCRWEDLRSYQLSNERLYQLTDSLINLMGTAVDRNFDRWPILGEWIWPNKYVGETYESEIYWMRNWITDRITQLDHIFPGECEGVPPPPPGEFNLSIYPNPFREKFTIQIISETNLNYNFMLFNLNGQLVLNSNIPAVEGINSVDVYSEGLRSGIFIYKLYKGNTELSVGKIVKM